MAMVQPAPPPHAAHAARTNSHRTARTQNKNKNKTKHFTPREISSQRGSKQTSINLKQLLNTLISSKTDAGDYDVTITFPRARRFLFCEKRTVSFFFFSPVFFVCQFVSGSLPVRPFATPQGECAWLLCPCSLLFRPLSPLLPFDGPPLGPL